MQIGVPKIPELLATNVLELLTSDWATGTTYTEGQKAYVPYSDFPDLLSYGTAIFDAFDKGVGWTYDGTDSAYDCDGTQLADSLLVQKNNELVAGDSYLVIFQATARTGGNIAPYVGGTSGTDRTAAGWYFEVVTAGATDKKIGLVGDLDFVGSVTNISIQKVSADYVARKIYESQTAANTGNWPPDDATNWTKVSASNRWKMFDDYMSSKTQRMEKVSVKMKANKCDMLAYFLAEATNLEYILSDDDFTETSTTSMTPALGDATFTMTTTNTIWAIGEKVEIYRTADQRAFMAGEITAWDSGTGVATVDVTAHDDPAGSAPYTDWTISRVYDHETETLITKNAVTWKGWYFNDFVYTTSKTFSFALGYNTSLRVIFTGPDNSFVRAGHMVTAKTYYIGSTLYGVRGGIQSFSVKQQNDFGEYTAVKRGNSQTLKYTVYLKKGAFDAMNQLLRSLDTVPCVFAGNNDDPDPYSALTVFAFYQSFDWEIPGYNEHNVDLELQELA